MSLIDHPDPAHASESTPARDRRARDLADDVVRLAAGLPDPGVVGAAASIDVCDVASSAFDVDRLLASTAVFAAAALGERGIPLRLDHLLAWCTTFVEVDGEPVPAWGELSGVYPTADDGHVQIHCNFPHHAHAVAETLGVPEDRTAVADAMARSTTSDLEQRLVAGGAVAAALRTLDQWDRHPHAVATDGLPLVSISPIGSARSRANRNDRLGPSGDGPIRVLDCSRVLAGPIAGQLLAGSGADVLRLGAAHLPAVDVGVLSTGFGKRNAFADVRTAKGRTAVRELLSGADVWIDAYRPGAFAGHGLTPELAAELRPGIVVVQISAFDLVGPWAGRRGFDSIVQTATGIRHAGGEFAIDRDRHPADAGSSSTPRGLPVQALDYATGFLGAGIAAAMVEHRRRHGGSWLAQLSLLRTRDHLVSLGSPVPYVPAPVPVPDHLRQTVEAEVGRLTTVRPFLGGENHPPRPLGSSPPVWAS
ncbi:MAG: CoA transferase [Actinomycetota bacterium]